MNLHQAYNLSLERNESELKAREWQYQVKKFLKMESESVMDSGKWRMAHMILKRLGVEDDNCAWCGTDGPKEREKREQ